MQRETYRQNSTIWQRRLPTPRSVIGTPTASLTNRMYASSCPGSGFPVHNPVVSVRHP